MKITKNTTDLKIGTLLKSIKVEECAPFELGKIYPITNGDCVSSYEINNSCDYCYTINELGNYFELVDNNDFEKSNNMQNKTHGNQYFDIVAKLTNEFYEAHARMIRDNESGLHKDDLIRKAIESISTELGCPIDVLTLISEKIIFPETSFVHNNTCITLPNLDETGRLEIDPLLFYQNAYTEYMIDFYTHKFNFLLSDTNHVVDIYQTDDYYELDDYLDGSNVIDGVDLETLEEEGVPMFEAYIREIDTDDELEDTTTGRYCSIQDVVDELEASVYELLLTLEK